jgi:hypothetical protein
VPSTPTLARSGLREMEERDVSAVSELIRGTWSASTRSRCSRRIYGTSFSVSAALERVASTGRRQSQVVWTYFDEVRSSTLLSRLLLLNIAALVALRKFGHKEISYCSAADSPFMGCAARSIVATASFVATASLNACLRHSTLATILGDPSPGAHGSALLASGIAALVSTLAASQSGGYARQSVALCSAVVFVFALRLSNVTNPRRVLVFLLTPAHMADLSLAFLAVGAITLTSLLYCIGTVRVQPKQGKVDGRLLVALLCSVSGGGSKVTAVSFFGMGCC